jgi:small subunit ribosomal protein S20
MPIKHAAFKHLRQTKKRTINNKKAKASLKALVKSVRLAITGSDKKKAAEALGKAIKALDKAAQKKIIKKNKAARLKSRLARQVNALK